MRKKFVMVTLILALIACVFIGKNAQTQSTLYLAPNVQRPTQIGSVVSQNQSFTSEKNNIRYTIMSEGRVEVLPDMAEVCVKIEYVDIVKDKAQSGVKDLFASLKETLAGKGIVDIKSDNQYTYNSRYDGGAFNSSMYVRFDLLDLENIHQTLSGVENDYVTITGINYKVKDNEKWYCEALKNAITNAQSKMQNISDQTVKMLSVEEECCYYPVCMYREYDSSQIQNNENTPIEITASVKVVFEAE